ncbi:unnamed protein product [Ilex paraguariensis]|uniref:MLO-like protein n=1 Tax=Ilex paraguariensis TaxID=185542 RepID=A0ABC8SGP1_9AQUA
MAAGYGDRSLKETPTWAVALVCTVFVIISILIEHGIHKLGKWFQKRQKKAMIEALEKIKAELMLLGFISLLITVGTKPISKICIPTKAGDIMLPCKKEYKEDYDKDKDKDKGNGNDRRQLLWYAGDAITRRVLAAVGGDDYCTSKGKVALISQSGVHQLHIFIFVLAIFHVLYSVLTVALAKAKMKKWQAWEQETDSLEYQFTNGNHRSCLVLFLCFAREIKISEFDVLVSKDPSRFRLAHQTSFVRRHSGISRMPGVRWIVRCNLLNILPADR